MTWRHPFSRRDHARLVALKMVLRAGGLRWSEWAVKTPGGDHLRVGWDPRIENHQPAAHRTEP